MITKYLAVPIILSILFSTGIDNDAPLHRNGALLVEAATVTITETDGSGNLGGYDDAKGWHSDYSADTFALGDKVLSFYVYNPATNDIEDVLLRQDILLGSGR